MSRALAIAAALVAACSARTAFADLPTDRDTALPCRPTIACTADLVPAGTAEIEAGALHRRLAGKAEQWSFPLLLKQSLTDWLQLQIGSNGYTITRGKDLTQYLDDLSVTVKVHLLPQTTYLPSIALSAAVNVPTFAREGYLRTYDFLTTAYVSKDVGPVHADLNFGANLWRIEERPVPQGFAALALSMNLIAPFGAMIEGYFFSDASPVQRRDGGFLFAVSHSPRPWLVFDAGGDIGFFWSTRAYSMFVGMTVIPAILWRKKE